MNKKKFDGKIFLPRLSEGSVVEGYFIATSELNGEESITETVDILVKRVQEAKVQWLTGCFFKA